MTTTLPHSGEDKAILSKDEDHFNDFKSKRISPNKLQETFVAFANGDGGEIWIGIEDKKNSNRVQGYNNKEDANNLLQVLLESTQPSVENVDIEFVDFERKGCVLHLSIPKSPKVHYTANGDCFIRLNASTIKIKGERIAALGYAKGAYVYEKQPVDIAELEDYIESPMLKSYMERVKSFLPPETFLRKQRLITKKDDEWKPNVACVLMFDEEPQATLDTRCAIKIYRLLTSEKEYKREQLKEAPRTIIGPLEHQINQAISMVNELLKDAMIEVGDQMVKLKYPGKTIHEIIVNSVIHRDYSLNDDIHIRIFDNRIEIVSPGKLPGYITVNNIYDERFSRNPNIVRLLHNLPEPVNHDIGEGLDTARNEMKKAGLVDPEIDELNNSVKVIIKYKRIAALEDLVLKFFNENPNGQISNKMLREMSGEDDINKVKSALQRLRRMKQIEPVDPKASAFNYKYRKAKA